MSTRATIIIQDSDSKAIFYRHSDGYPKLCGAELVRFVQGYYSGAMRKNVFQSSGWLIVAGHKEYLDPAEGGSGKFTGVATMEDRYGGWKVGAYEIADSIGMGEEFVYIIDLEKCTLTCRIPNSAYWDKPTLKNTTACKEFPTVSFARLEVVA